jgi:hypothetical protein
MITTLLRDDFNAAGPDVNRALWTTPVGNAGFFGRTAIRNPDTQVDGHLLDGRLIAVSDGFAHLKLSTFNPTAQPDRIGQTVWGSEIDSQMPFALGNGIQGLEFSASVRSPAEMPPGIVTSVFGWGNRAADLHDEIDWEFASNLYRAAVTPHALLNRYANEPTGAGHPIDVTMDAGFDFTGPHTFSIRYFTGRIEWLVDGAVTAMATSNVPTGPLTLRLNVWAPDTAFAIGYSPALQIATTAAGNVDYDYQIDWAQVLSTTTNFGDTVQSRISYTLAPDVPNLTLTGSASINGTGNALPNVLVGNAANNVLDGDGGDDTLIGGAGLDVARYAQARSLYSGSRSGQDLTIIGPDGRDTLDGIERLQFVGSKLALDLDAGQSAGNAVRLIGAAFDAQFIPTFISTGIALFDAGSSTLQVANAALSTAQFRSLAGSTGNVDFVNTVYRNIIGHLPSAAERDVYVGLLQGSGGSMTQAELLVFAANTPENALNINLIGLQQTGVEFT